MAVFSVVHWSTNRFGAALLGLATIGLIVGFLPPAEAASGRVSAHLTQTSFAVAEAGQVRLVYQFSSRSHHFGYVLSRKQGSRWVEVRRVNKKGRFTGSHSKTVKQIFGSHAIRAARYRVRVSADANSVKMRFQVIAPASGSVKPQSGLWTSTSVNSGMVTNVSFTVLPDQATVYRFTFGYDYSGAALPPFTTSCSGSGVSYATSGTPTLITDGEFSGPVSATGPWFQSNSAFGGSGSWTGTFDSTTSAHGTATFNWGFVGFGCMQTRGTNGPFDWTATRQG